MSMNLVTLLYLLASVCFIQALKGLSHPTTARRGNAFGMTGMAIAAVTTIALIYKLKAEMFAGTESGASTGFILIFAGLVVGGGIGAYVARTVEMTKMPLNNARYFSNSIVAQVNTILTNVPGWIEGEGVGAQDT